MIKTVWGVVWIACAAALPAVAETAASTTFDFVFAPPGGTEYLQTIEATRTKRFEGLGEQIDWSKSETSVSIERVESGFRMEATPLSVEMTRDGKPVVDSIAQMLQGVVVSYRVDSDGQIQSVDGYDGLVDRVTESLPPEAVEAIRSALSEETLVAKEIAEWNGRVGDFVGGEFEIGESFEGEVPFTLPSGESIIYRTRTWFPGFEPCPAGTCVRVETRYDSDAEALGAVVSEMVKGIASSASEDFALSTARPRIAGSASRLIDPATMLIYEETVARNMALEVELPGAGAVPALVTEKREYSFEYQSPGDAGH